MSDQVPYKPVSNDTNPLLQRIRIPGVHFRLPSNGMFYKEGVLDNTVVNGEVVVFPITTIDELTLRNVDGLINGNAVEEVFARCIPQIKQPKNLLSRDVDYLMIALKKVSYGNDVEVEYTHECDQTTPIPAAEPGGEPTYYVPRKHKYVFNLGAMIQQTAPIDPTTMKDNFSITLENGQTVNLRPVIYSDFIAMLQNLKSVETKTDEEMKRTMVESTAYIVESVDGETDRERIKEWLSVLPRAWFEAISKAVDKGSAWGVNTSQEFDCKVCKEKFTIDLPVNPVTFFT